MSFEPSSCSVCSRPLTPGSVSDVCPVCALTPHVMGPAPETLRPVATVGPTARVRPAGEPGEPALPPNPPGLALVRRLGVGGMGSVYLAADAATRRLVAVKLLHAPGDRAAFDRFQAEVRVLAELNHPHIVGVYAADLTHHAPFYTMEYAPGGTLARYVGTRGPLPPLAAAALVATVARAAHAAHERDIVHRDIKPGNVLLGGGSETRTANAEREAAPTVSDYTPKLSDFGLAKRTDRNEGLTVGPGAVGTPGFMAPEQAAGGTATPRTDVYGLGATLYHALTGRAPFEHEDARELMALVRSAEPRRVRYTRPEVPAELEAIVHRCLEKDPDARYASAADLAADLDRFVRAEPVAAKPLTPARRARKALARNRRALGRVAVTVLALAAVFALGAVLRGPAEANEAKALREMQADLKAGKDVTLVGPAGNPRWHKWVHGPAAFAPSAGRGDACSFQALDVSMLDLCQDPMTDRYRVRAELCQLDVNGRAQDGRLPTGGTFEFGLYFGRQVATGANGWRAENCLAVRLTELETGGGHAKLGRVLVTDAPGRSPDISGESLAHAPISPSKALPGPWRLIEIEVTPEFVKAWVGAPGEPTVAFAELRGATVGRSYTAPNEALDRFAPEHGITFGAWNPRAPLGVWSARSALAVRNVTVIPLARPNP